MNFIHKSNESNLFKIYRFRKYLSVIILQGRSDKMTTRLTMMNQRYQDLERRRNLEVEGFKNDIKNLRSRLKDVERQLYKVSTSGSQVDW